MSEIRVAGGGESTHGKAMPILQPRLREQIIYASGEVASNLAWNMVSGYLLFYYTDIALLPVAALGSLVLFSRVLDGLIDPLMGIIVDKTHSRWGKARPYLLFASIPFGILCTLTFAVPDVAPLLKLIYAYITFTLLGAAYSAVYIPYASMQPMITGDHQAQVRMGGLRAAATSLASIVVYALIPPFTNMLGAAHRPQAYSLTAALFSVVTVAIYLLVFGACRERVAPAVALASGGIRRSLIAMVRNPRWRVNILYVFTSFLRLATAVSLTVYFVKYVLQKPWMLAVIFPLLSVAIFLGGAMAGPLLARFNAKAVNLWALAASLVLSLVLPHVEAMPVILLLVYVAANVQGGITGATLFINNTRAVQYQERHFGMRDEGLMVSCLSLGQKIGFAFGSAATAYALALAGYHAGTTSPQVIGAIRDLFYYAPVVLLLIQIAVVATGDISGRTDGGLDD